MDRPATVAGPQIRVLYAYPFDAQNRSVERAAAISADVEEIERWWRTQDSARAPRFDRAAFACGNQADIRTLPVQAGEGSLRNVTRLEKIIHTQAIAAEGGDAASYRYLVFFDGARARDTQCGAAEGSPEGSGIGVVYLQACPGVPTATVAAHVLLEALGVPGAPGPPNACPQLPRPPSGVRAPVFGGSKFFCDSAGDIMQPYAPASQLSALVIDPGQNDYYAHSGSWPDVQDSPWLLRVDAQTRLSFTVSGPGKLRSDLPGVNCDSNCGLSAERGSRLTLTPTPAPGNKLVSWTGACTASTATCALAISGDTSAGAIFAPLAYQLTLKVRGKGSVRASRAGLKCPKRCSAAVASWLPTRLTAQPAKGWRLQRWTGLCTTRQATCSLSLKANAVVSATFVRIKS